MNTPKISIIIPVYKAQKYISTTIELLLMQSFSSFEIILIDDGSPDNSGAICDEYAKKDSRIKVFHQENQGAGAARNLGLDNANGELIWLIDADDSIAENALEIIVENFEKNPDLDLLIFEAMAIKDGIILNGFLQRKELKEANTFINEKSAKNLFKFATPSTWNKCYKKDLLKKNELYFQNIKTCNDVYFVISALAIANNIFFLDKALYFYNKASENAISNTRGKHSLCIIESGINVVNKLKSLNLYDKYKFDIYDFYSLYFFNEYKISTQKAEFKKLAKKFLPFNFYTKFSLRIIKDKILTLLGIRK